MQFLLFGLFAAGIVAVDQWTKYLTVANIALFGKVEFIPGFRGNAVAVRRGIRGIHSADPLGIFQSTDAFPYLRPLVHRRDLWRRLGQYDRPDPPGLCGGYDFFGLHPLPRIQCGGLLHHLRLRGTAGAPGIFQPGLLEG